MALRDEEQRTNHPAYANIMLSNPRGGGQVLYGSAMEHDSTLEITISESTHIRSLHHDDYRPGKTIVALRMSESQFARFVASTGVGCGTPCTLVERDGKTVERLKPDHIAGLRATFENEMKERFNKVMENVQAASRHLDTLANQKRISKTDIREAQSKLYKARQDVESNIPWMMQVFVEHLDKASDEVLGEIESFVNKIVQKNEALLSREDLPQMGNLLGPVEGATDVED